MKRKHVILSLLFATLLISVVVHSCKKDPVPLALSSLVAGTIDLNGATSPANVPVMPTITATFNVAVDPATATAANITMIQDYDDAPITLDIAVDDKVITITPTADLGTGTLYQLNFSAGLKSIDGLALTALQRTFTTAGAFAPSGTIAHWTFEDNANDIIGAYDPVPADIIGITYTASRNTAAGKAATFNGTTSIIEVPNGDDLMNTNFSIAFWVKTNSVGKTSGGHFVLGLAGWHGFQFEIFGGYDGAKLACQYQLATTGTDSEDMWFPSLADVSFSGWTYAKSLTIAEMTALLKDKWLHVVFSYDAPTKVATLYYNGEKMKSFDFNLFPAANPKKGAIGPKFSATALGTNLAFGFIQGRNNRTITDTWADYAHADANGHFKGQLDDIRIWHKSLKASEVLLMYNSEKP
ncbi:MAG: Ig-like domain-containing protein [Bacteroidales bacterium]|nr:Ig-like domain-containing protein [Bacteroidales bacterium]